MANISETVRAISSKFWTHSVVEGFLLKHEIFNFNGKVPDP